MLSSPLRSGNLSVRLGFPLLPLFARDEVAAFSVFSEINLHEARNVEFSPFEEVFLDLNLCFE